MESIVLDWGMAMGIPPGCPVPWLMWSIRVVSGWAWLKVTRRPAPADSKPSGMEGMGEGWIVVRVWGIWVFGEGVVGIDVDCGYVGAV